MNKSEALKLLIANFKQMPEDFRGWLKTDAKYFAISFGSLITFFVAIGLVMPAQMKKVLAEVVFFDTEVDQAVEETPIEHFEIGETPVEPTVLNTESLTEPPASIEQDAQFNDNSAVFEASGGGTATSGASFGLGGFDVNALGSGPAVRGPGGVGVGAGTSDKAGSGGAGDGFGGRGSGSRQAMVASGGGTLDSERAVAGALNWMARHQNNSDGSWGCAKFVQQCKDPSCAQHNRGTEGADYPMAATAFALLPFLAAGQTHESKGPYAMTIKKGLQWMAVNQDKSGRLGGTMYEHGLATIALCEAYGLSKDQKLKNSAQGAVNYIQATQHSEGGWRYGPNQPGDTSVVGWQMMGLKSAQMAGLNVDKKTLDKAKSFLKSVSKGKAGGLYSYTPESGPTPCMSAVGLLCSQYSGMKRTDPAMVEGMNYIMANLPASGRNCYYWYYATQVMHNLPGPEWDAWNRHARRLLLSTQIKEGCASGSWSPEGHPHAAGPMMVTGICALSLEVYYRYLPLYQLDNKKQALMPDE